MKKSVVPHSNHVVVHLLQLLLGHLQGVRRRVDLISLEALIGEADGKRLVLFLQHRESASAFTFPAVLAAIAQFSALGIAGTDLWDIFSMRRGGVGGDGAAGKGSKSLAPQGRGLTGPRGSEQHDGRRSGSN
jgi:hypothetical protein